MTTNITQSQAPARAASAIEWAGRRSLDATMALMLVLGALNLADLPSSLAAWTTLPEPARTPVLVALPALQVGIALVWFLWFTKRTHRVAWPAALAVLALSAAASAAQLIRAKLPDCDCVGLIAAFRATQAEVRAALTRDGLLIGALLAGALLAVIGRPARATPPLTTTPPTPAAKPRADTGFSLIETIMVISAIGLLLALTLPQLGMVRQAAQRAKSLSNLRTHVQAFTMYSSDHEAQFPFFMRPDAPETIIRGGGVASPVPLKHFFWASSAHWPIAMASYYDDVAYHESTFTPQARAQNASFVVYHYSNNFVATPDYWRPGSRLSGTSQYRSIHQGQVRHPSNKGLMLDTWSYYAGDASTWPPRAQTSVLVGAVDGSARSVDRGALAPTYGPGPPEHPMATWPIVHTVGGVHAADVP